MAERAVAGFLPYPCRDELSLGAWIDLLLELPPGQHHLPYKDIVEEVQKRLIEKALHGTGGNVSRAALLLGIKRDELRYAMGKRRLGVKQEAGQGQAS